MRPLEYVECPRDAWQGLPRLIPTPEKVRHLQALLDAGLTRLDMGSFVSPRAVPQLADTEEVLSRLKPPPGAELLCIVANQRGLERAVAAPHLSSVGYPLSVNDTFQKRNVGMGLRESWPLVAVMLQSAEAAGLRLVVYVSMGFGNPYGDPWTPSDTAGAVSRLREMGVRHIALADTVGTATPERLDAVLGAIPEPGALGLHLHARPDGWQESLGRALEHGLRWFEGALAGVGGCPFAADALLGNLPTERVLPWLEQRTGNRLVAPDALNALAEDAASLAAAHGVALGH